MGRIEIYGLFSDDDRIRYIGKAKDSAKRWASHFRDGWIRKTPLYKWMWEMVRSDRRLGFVVLAVTLGEDWEETERRMIAQWRSLEPDLLNKAKGGNEPPNMVEIRRQNGRKVAHAIHSDPVKKEIWRKKHMVGIMAKLRNRYRKSAI